MFNQVIPPESLSGGTTRVHKTPRTLNHVDAVNGMP